MTAMSGPYRDARAASARTPPVGFKPVPRELGLVEQLQTAVVEISKWMHGLVNSPAPSPRRG